MPSKPFDESIKELEAQLEEAVRAESEKQDKATEEHPSDAGEDDTTEQEDGDAQVAGGDEEGGDADEGDADDDDEDADSGSDKAGHAWGKLRHKYKEEKRQREELQAKLVEIQERLARQEGAVEAFKTFNPNTANSPQLKEDAEPDPVLEREEWLEWKIRQQEKVVQSVLEKTKRFEQLSLVEQAKREIAVLEQNYSKDVPDYGDAMQFLQERAYRILKRNNPRMSDADIHRTIEESKVQDFSLHVSRGANPAEQLYLMAQDLGYTKPQQEAKGQTTNTDAVRRNKEKSASLIGASRAGNSKGLTPEQVLRMPYDQITEAKINEALEKLGMRTAG